MSNIGENIKRIRKEKGYSQKQLAEKLGTTPQNLAQYENGKRIPKIETLDKIASALDVFIADINEDITWNERKNTSEVKRINKEINAIEGIIAILNDIYGDVTEKDVQTEYGESFYYLVGNNDMPFILYEGDIEYLYNYIKSSLPFIVDAKKDSRAEELVINEIKAGLNDPEWIAKVKKYIEESVKKTSELLPEPPEE